MRFPRDEPNTPIPRDRSTGRSTAVGGGPVVHLDSVSAAIATGKRPAPFRTRKLSPSAPMVLPGGPGGRVGRRRTFFWWVAVTPTLNTCQGEPPPTTFATQPPAASAAGRGVVSDVRERHAVPPARIVRPRGLRGRAGLQQLRPAARPRRHARGRRRRRRGRRHPLRHGGRVRRVRDISR